MVVDTSAITAVLMNEPLARKLVTAMHAATSRLVSSVSVVEATIMLESRKGPQGARNLDLFMYRMKLEVASVNEQQIELARIAWRRFGKGRHRAALNLGDCFSYALAKSRGFPLLFCGHGFRHTDITPALRDY